jgi:signal peptidase
MEKNSTRRTEYLRSLIPGLIILVLVVGIYLLINLAIREHVSNSVSAYVVQPILWAGVILATLRASPSGLWGRMKLNKSFLGICLLLGALQIAVLLIAGLLAVNGLGRSPYSHSIDYLLLNTIFFVSSLVGMEFSRAFLMKTFSERGTMLVLVAVALLYTFLMTSLTKFTNMTSPFTFFSGTFLPLLAQNVLACLLALLGGPIASIAFWGIINAFQWYSPILPDPTWIVRAFAITMAAVIGLLVVQSLYGLEGGLEKPEPAKPKDKAKKRSSPVGWVLVAIVCVVIIFSSFGALGFRPLLVGSGSMKPALDVGDIAFVKPISAESINKGDIIEFQDSTGAKTLHRVIDIQQDGNVLKFITKGDANDSPDLYPIPPENIKGKVLFRIPKVGWISIGFKNLIT